MKYEVEKKARLRDPSAVEAAVGKLASFEGESQKEDRYYLIGARPGDRIDMKRDPIFRVRTEGGRCVICAKKRLMRADSEVNEEVEIPAGGPEETVWFFERYLGIAPFVVKRKRTRLYAMGDMHVEINHVDGLGPFLEVEIIKERLDGEEEGRTLRRIDGLFERLGIPGSDVEPRYYIEMLMEKKGY